MAASTRSGRAAKRKDAAPPDDWLDAGDRRWIIYGAVFSLFLVIGLGGIMLALRQSGSTGKGVIDPDAQTVVIKPDYPRHLVDFTLTDQQGRAVTRRDLQGKIVVVNFVFTNCSLVCSFINDQMKKIQAATMDRPDVRLLSLALDPADDTVAVLGGYAPRFGALPERWSFLTGDNAVMHDFVAASFLPPDTTGQFSYMPGNFAHTQRIALVNKTGQIVNYFDGLNEKVADAVIEQIKTLGKMNP